MYASKAFKLTFGFISKCVTLIFSFGYSELKDSDGYLPIPLFLLGQFANYVIAYPLGLLVGGLGAGIVALINLFKSEEKHEPSQTANKDFENFESSLSTSESQTVKAPSFTTQKKLQSMPINEQQTSLTMSAIDNSGFLQKKSEFLAKIEQLNQLIDQKMNELDVNCEAHSEYLKKYKELAQTLDAKTLVAKTAEKFSHTNTATSAVPMFAPNRIGQQLGYFTFVPVSTTVDVYVADEELRNSAKIECEALKKELDSYSLEHSDILNQFTKRDELRNIKNSLKFLQSSIKITFHDLSTGLETYKKYLEQLAPFLFSGGSHKKSDYLPVSNYSELLFASLMVEQLKRQNAFFQKMPNEINEKIMLNTVSPPSFPEKEAKEISNTVIGFFNNKGKRDFEERNLELSLSY